jgi:transcriptional regulator with XRE-family HTH domain
LSQDELGVRSRIHRNYIGAMERGEINATFAVLLKLARGLDMPLSRLIAEAEQLRRDPHFRAVAVKPGEVPKPGSHPQLERPHTGPGGEREAADAVHESVVVELVYGLVDEDRRRRALRSIRERELAHQLLDGDKGRVALAEEAEDLVGDVV